MNNFHSGCKLVSLWGMIIALTQCSPVGVDYSLPYVATPDAWSNPIIEDSNSGSVKIKSWMSVFNDTQLIQLLNKAKKHNKDLKIAAQTVSIARYQTKNSRANFQPTVTQSLGVARERASENFTNSSQGDTSSFKGGFLPSWEVDLFGQLRRTLEFAERNETATAEAHRDLMVAIYAEVSSLYIDHRTLQARLKVNKDQVSSLEETVQIAKDKLEAGLTSKLDLLQSQTELKNATSFTPLLNAQLTRVQNALAVLCGCYSRDLKPLLSKQGPIPSPNRLKSIPLPSSLVRARPDIRSAERTLAAQVARIGIAEAELYPKLKLVGNFALQSRVAPDFLESKSLAYSFGPSFEWNIFSGGRLRNAIRSEEAATEQALLTYEKSILNAVAEVEVSMANIALERDRYGQLGEALEHSKEALDLVKESYKEGLTDFERVIDSERAQYTTEDNVVLSKGEIAKFYVALYRSLGGGVSYQPVAIDSPRILSKKYAKNIKRVDSKKDEKNK